MIRGKSERAVQLIINLLKGSEGVPWWEWVYRRTIKDFEKFKSMFYDTQISWKSIRNSL